MLLIGMPFFFINFFLQAFRVFRTNDVNVQMISQGASKVLALNYSSHIACRLELAGFLTGICPLFLSR